MQKWNDYVSVCEKTEAYAHRSDIFKVLLGQVWSNFHKQWRWTLLTPLHFITSGLNLDGNKRSKFKIRKQIKWINRGLIFSLQLNTFLIRSFNCFLPWSFLNPGVFGDETLITCEEVTLVIVRFGKTEEI